MADGGVVSGFSGEVTIGAPYTDARTVIHVFEWNATIVNSEFMATAFEGAGTDTAHTYGVGLYQLTGHIRGHMDGTTKIVAGWLAPDRDEAAIVLRSFEGSTTDQELQFNGHLNNIVMTVDKQSGQQNLIEADIVSSGAVTPVAGATA